MAEAALASVAMALPTAAAVQAQPAWQPSAAARHRMRLAGIRPTQQRLAVLKALNDNAARFLDVEALHHATLGADVAVQLSTVCRILVEMEKAKIAQSTKQGARVLYRQVPDDEVAQPHFVCTRCGLAEPLGNDALMSQLFEGAGRHGFHLSPRIALVGLCSGCSARQTIQT